MQPSPSMSASSTNASHSIKLLVVDATIPIYVRLINQCVTFLLRHLLAQVHHDMPQLHPAPCLLLLIWPTFFLTFCSFFKFINPASTSCLPPPHSVLWHQAHGEVGEALPTLLLCRQG